MESQEASCAPERTSAKTSRPVGAILAAMVILGLAGVISWWLGLGSYLVQQREYAGKTATFAGSSESLRQTVVVPTLDSPVPPGRNVIWCSSFQLAWNGVKDEVIGAPLEVIGAEELAARLNMARQSVSDVDAGSVYVAAGRIREGVIERIEKEMAAKFPSHKLPDFNEYALDTEGILSYSFLRANVPFKHPFRQLDGALTFRDSEGTETQVGGFGLWKAYLRRYESISKQVEILYVRWGDRDQSGELKEYALDLCRHSEPLQVVVAVVEPRGSLVETLDHLRTQMVDFKGSPDYEWERRFGANDELRVPEMFWRIDHRFTELIDKIVANTDPPMPILEALQTIELRLDRSGAVLESEAALAIESAPRYFEFNRPFLVYMQKRGAEHPFFVMWVDNAELLVRR